MMFIGARWVAALAMGVVLLGCEGRESGSSAAREAGAASEHRAEATAVFQGAWMLVDAPVQPAHIDFGRGTLGGTDGCNEFGAMWTRDGT